MDSLDSFLDPSGGEEWKRHCQRMGNDVLTGRNLWMREHFVHYGLWLLHLTDEKLILLRLRNAGSDVQKGIASKWPLAAGCPLSFLSAPFSLLLHRWGNWASDHLRFSDSFEVAELLSGGAESPWYKPGDLITLGVCLCIKWPAFGWQFHHQTNSILKSVSLFKWIWACWGLARWSCVLVTAYSFSLKKKPLTYCSGQMIMLDGNQNLFWSYKIYYLCILGSKHKLWAGKI